MIRTAFCCLLLAASAFAQDKPQVTIKKMTDAEYQRLNDTRDAMQKAAEAYRKAADAYQKAHEGILGKYDGLDSRDQCGNPNKIVDIRGPYVIVEIRPSSNYNSMRGITFGSDGCGIFLNITTGTTYLPAVTPTPN